MGGCVPLSMRAFHKRRARTHASFPAEGMTRPSSRTSPGTPSNKRPSWTRWTWPAGRGPPAPNLDPLDSPTGLTKIWVTGSAEYNAKIQITGGKADVSTVSDAFTARFRAQVELNPDAKNTLSVIATDAAGNVSDPTTVDVV